MKLPGAEFNKHWEEVKDHALLSTSERHVVLFETVSNLLSHFPELHFITQNLRFVDPLRRDHVCCDLEKVLDWFDNNFFNTTAVECEYALFQNDDTLDALLECGTSDEHVTTCQFWCWLY